MSYRNYIYEIENKELEKLKKLNIKEIEEKYGDETGFVWLPKLVGKCLFELGSRNDFNTEIIKSMKPIFVDKNTNDYFNSDSQTIGIVDKSVFLIIIEMMRKEIQEMYEEYFETPEKAKSLFERRALDWANKTEKYYYGQLPYNLKGESITNSTHYEYAIFELVRLYKTIDSNKTLIYMGY